MTSKSIIDVRAYRSEGCWGKRSASFRKLDGVVELSPSAIITSHKESDQDVLWVVVGNDENERPAIVSPQPKKVKGTSDISAGDSSFQSLGRNRGMFMTKIDKQKKG